MVKLEGGHAPSGVPVIIISPFGTAGSCCHDLIQHVNWWNRSGTYLVFIACQTTAAWRGSVLRDGKKRPVVSSLMLGLCICDLPLFLWFRFFLCTMCLIQVSIVSSCSFSVSVVSLVHSLGVSCVPCSWFGCVMPPVFDSGVCYGPCLWFRCRMSPVFGSGVCYVLCLWFRHLQCPLSLVQASVTSPIFGSGVCYVACLWFRLLFCPLYLF